MQEATTGEPTTDASWDDDLVLHAGNKFKLLIVWGADSCGIKPVLLQELPLNDS